MPSFNQSSPRVLSYPVKIISLHELERLFDIHMNFAIFGHISQVDIVEILVMLINMRLILA